MTTDLDLIKSIKDKQDSAALTELVSRHTGVYATIINQYAGYSPAINKRDLFDERLYNIWEYAKAYKPELGMKFSTYVGERTKYLCKTLLSQQKPELGEMPTSIADEHDFVQAEEARDDIEELLKHTHPERDAEFRVIIQMRTRESPATWNEIGDKMGMSHEWARKLYYRRLEELKKKVLS